MSTKSVPFDLPGFKRPRELRFDYNAIADLENALGLTPQQIFQTRAGLFTIRGLLWAGLKHEQPNLTIDAVGGMIQAYLSEFDGELEVLSDFIGQAIKASGLFKVEEPDGEEGEAKGDSGNAGEGAEAESKPEAPSVHQPASAS